MKINDLKNNLISNNFCFVHIKSKLLDLFIRIRYYLKHKTNLRNVHVIGSETLLSSY